MNRTGGKTRKMSIYPVPSALTAVTTGTSKELVRAVRTGGRVTGKKAILVQKADQMLQEGLEKLIGDVREQL